MASAKKKKEGAALSVTKSVSTEINLTVLDVGVDDEPKVSFSLEFYALQDQDKPFVGRIKKNGSEEEISLMEGLEETTLIQFITRNLPNAWRTAAGPSGTPTARDHSSVLPTPASSAAMQRLESSPASQSLLLGPATTDKGQVEIWQNGTPRQVVAASLPCSIYFQVGQPRFWKQFSVHFKPLEPNLPSFSFFQHQVKSEKLALELSEGQLTPGMYSLGVSAVAEPIPPETPTPVVGQQLIQVV